MGIKRIFITIRNFLFSNVNKQFLVFLFFLFLSGIFWLIITLNESYEHEVGIPVRIVGVPKNVVLTSPSEDTISIMVSDKGWVLMSYLYGDKLKNVTIPFRTYDHGGGIGNVASSDLRRLVEQNLVVSSRVTAIKPERLQFHYNNGECKRVPIRWAGRVIPDQLYFISQVEYQPDSVDVYASPEKLENIRAVYSEQLNYVNFRDTLTVECRLAHEADVKVVPERARILFHTDVLTEEDISGIPIKCLNLPVGKVLRTFPAKAKVHFVAGVSQLRTLRPEDFTVVADYREIEQGQKDKCNIYLRHVPQGVSRATLSVSQVDYVIEEE